MHPFEALGDPVRRRVLEVLTVGERTAGAVSSVVEAEFAISQPAVSRHLRVLREAGLVSVRPEGARRVYAVDPAGLDALQRAVDTYRRTWEQRLDALGTEIARGRRERRLGGAAGRTAPPPGVAARQRAAGETR